MVQFDRDSRELKTVLETGLPLQACRTALEDAGRAWMLSTKTFVFVHPSQYCEASLKVMTLLNTYGITDDDSVTDDDRRQVIPIANPDPDPIPTTAFHPVMPSVVFAASLEHLVEESIQEINFLKLRAREKWRRSLGSIAASPSFDSASLASTFVNYEPKVWTRVYLGLDSDATSSESGDIDADAGADDSEHAETDIVTSETPPMRLTASNLAAHNVADVGTRYESVPPQIIVARRVAEEQNADIEFPDTDSDYHTDQYEYDRLQIIEQRRVADEQTQADEQLRAGRAEIADLEF